jgi:hypothetical protein
LALLIRAFPEVNHRAPTLVTMRIGLLTAYHLGEEITIQGHSSNGKEFTLTGTLIDVEHSFEDDTEYGLVDFVDPRGVGHTQDALDEDPGEEASEDDEPEDLEDDEFEDDDEYVRSGLFTEVSLRLSETTDITIELPADHEVTVESLEHEDDDEDDDTEEDDD